MGVVPIGGGRSLKVVGQEWRSGGVFPVESMDEALAGSGLWGTGTTISEADDNFCEHVLFCHGFKNDTANLHSLPTSVQYEMKEKSIWRQKSARQATVPVLAHWVQKWAGNCNCQFPSLPSTPPMVVPARKPLQRAASLRNGSSR